MSGRTTENFIHNHPEGNTRKERAYHNFINLMNIVTQGYIHIGGKTSGKDVSLTREQRFNRKLQAILIKRKYNL